MKYLNLEDNVIEEEGLIAISSCLKRIEKLGMNNFINQNYSKRGINSLFAIIKKLDEPVQIIDLCCRNKTFPYFLRFLRSQHVDFIQSYTSCLSV